jgi:hypothetical protein
MVQLPVRHQSILQDFERLVKHEMRNIILILLCQTFSSVTSQLRTHDSLDCGGRSAGCRENRFKGLHTERRLKSAYKIT